MADQIKDHPYESAGILKRASMWWMVPTLKKGHHQKLDYEDIFAVPKILQSSRLSESHERWFEKFRVTEKGPIQLVKALWRTHAFDWITIHLTSTICELVCQVILPLCIDLMVRYFVGNDGRTFSEGVLYTSTICLMSVFWVILNHTSFYYGFVLGLKIKVAFSSLLYKKLLRLSNSSLKKVHAGYITNMLSSDLQKFDFAILFLHYIWIAPLQLIIVGYILYNEVGFICFLGIGLFTLFIPLESIMGRIFAKLRYKVALATDKRSRLMHEIITGIKVIKVYAWEHSFAKELAKLRFKEFGLLKMVNVFRAINFGLSVVVVKVIMVLTMTVYAHHQGTLFNGQRFFLLLAMFYIMKFPVAKFFAYSLSHGSEAWTSIKRIHEFLCLDEFDRSQVIPLCPKLLSLGCSVHLENLTASWNEEASPILKDINLKVTTGDLLMIVGSVGSGKSSLLMTLLGDIPVTKGQLFVNGSISYASQDPCIFPGTVKYNIVFDNKFDVAKYKEVINICALKSDLEMFPFGDKTMVGERGILVSGGQKARICLARALYYDADIYVLDDPLSAVDVKVCKHIFEKCILSYLGNKTVILATHQLQYLRHASQIVVLQNGQKQFQGTYDDFKIKEFTNLECTITKNHDEDLTLRKRLKISDKLDLNSKDLFEDKFMEKSEKDESRKEGTVQWGVYFKFLMAGGGIIGILFLMLFNLSSNILNIYSDYWLSIWMDAEIEERNKIDESVVKNRTVTEIPFTIERHKFYVFYIIISVSGIVLVIATALVNYVMCITAAKNLHDVTFLKLLHSPMVFFHKNSVGRIQNRFTKDVGQVDDFIPVIFTDVITMGLTTATIVTLVGVVNYVVLIPAAFLLVISLWIKKFAISTLRDIKRMEGTSKSPVFSHVSTTTHSLSTIRAFRAEEKFIKKFDTLQDLNSTCWFMIIGANRWFAQIIDSFAVIFISSTAISCLLLSKDISSGEIGFALTQAIQLCDLFQFFLRQSAELESHMVSVERILEYGKLETEILDRTPSNDKPPKDWPSAGQLTFQDMSLKYNADLPNVLKSITCQIYGSKKVGIVGRTGAGKSSMITSLFRLYEPQGVINIDGVPTNKLALHDLRSKISIIPQDPLLFTNTMKYNLDPFSQCTDEELWQALEQVHLKDKISQQSAALTSEVAEGGCNFSVGERQLICLARAMLKKNKILILDEATANVDFRTDEIIQKTIRDVFKDCTVLTIAHRLETIMDSDRILLLNNGEIAEYDSPKILLADKNSQFYNMVKESGIDMSSISFHSSCHNKTAKVYTESTKL